MAEVSWRYCADCGRTHPSTTAGCSTTLPIQPSPAPESVEGVVGKLYVGSGVSKSGWRRCVEVPDDWPPGTRVLVTKAGGGDSEAGSTAMQRDKSLLSSRRAPEADKSAPAIAATVAQPAPERCPAATVGTGGSAQQCQLDAGHLGEHRWHYQPAPRPVDQEAEDAVNEAIDELLRNFYARRETFAAKRKQLLELFSTRLTEVPDPPVSAERLREVASILAWRVREYASPKDSGELAHCAEDCRQLADWLSTVTTPGAREGK